MHARTILLLIVLLLAGRASAADVLVDGAWLESHLQAARVVVVDMTDDDLQYVRYHIPGAVRIGYHALLKPGGRGRPNVRLADAEFAALLGQYGIGHDSHVVIYDDVGGLNAGRLFLELERVRHPQVSVLDGGLVQWVLDGRRVDNRPVERKPVAYVPAAARRENLATFADVRQATANAIPLLDVRSREEYTGDPKDPRSGHIPGARWWPWEQAIRMDRGFTFETPQALLASLDKAGVQDKRAPVVVYCRSGHRAGQTYLALRYLGFENVRLHAGSMLEYLIDVSAPLMRGNAP